MTIAEVYGKFKHLDEILSDRRWVENDLVSYVLYELWQTVKEEVGKEVEIPFGTQEIMDMAFQWKVENL